MDKVDTGEEQRFFGVITFLTLSVSLWIFKSIRSKERHGNGQWFPEISPPR